MLKDNELAHWFTAKDLKPTNKGDVMESSKDCNSDKVSKSTVQRLVIFLIIPLFLLLLGCDKDMAADYGKKRHELFVECMELAAKMPRQQDDDVGDIVDECTDSSYYLANSF